MSEETSTHVRLHAGSMIQLDTSPYKPADAFDLWNELTRGIYSLHNPAPGAFGITMCSENWVFEEGMISDVRASENYKWRNRSHIRQDARRYLKLRRYLSGTAFYEGDGNKRLMQPGATYLMDQSEPSAEISAKNHQLNIFLPLDVFEGACVDVPPFREWKDDTLEGGLLLAAWNDLFDLARASAVAGPSFRDGMLKFQSVFLDVLTRAADSFGEINTVNARRAFLEAEIERSLLEPSLSVDSLLTKVHMSRASLYRHFGSKRGVAAHVRRRRLEFAYKLLREAGGERGAVTRTAHVVGYTSVHSFHKAFKREFGFKPGDIVGLDLQQYSSRGSLSVELLPVAGPAQDFRQALQSVRGR